jgi:toxin ParE1/3/4
MRVVWTDPALDGIERVHDYLFDLNPHAAAGAPVHCEPPETALANFPRRGRCVAGTSMRELVACFDYVIRYQIHGDAVEILRVRHTSRRPTIP